MVEEPVLPALLLDTLENILILQKGNTAQELKGVIDKVDLNPPLILM